MFTLAVNFPENIYMIHPDLICIFNSIIPEQKSEDPDTLKKHISAEVSRNTYFSIIERFESVEVHCSSKYLV